MARTKQIAVRLDPEVKAALERAAKAEHEFPSTIAARLIRDWLRRQGLLKETKGRGKDNQNG